MENNVLTNVTMRKTILCGLLFAWACLFIDAVPGDTERRITVEAPSPDPTLAVRGPEKAVAGINDPAWETKKAGLYLFTGAFGKPVTTNRKTGYTIVYADASLQVTAVIDRRGGRSGNPAAGREKPLPAAPAATGGLVLVAFDEPGGAAEFSRFLSDGFRKGDRLRLRINGEIAPAGQLEALAESGAAWAIVPEADFPLTVADPMYKIKGKIVFPGAPVAGCRLTAVGKKGKTGCRIDAGGNFSAALPLVPGTNYFDLVLTDGGAERARLPLIVYRRAKEAAVKERIMWVEQFPNALTLTSRETVAEMAEKTAQAGFTALGLDVKGPEGYVSYRKNDLSGSPYLTATRNPKKKIPDDGFDLLQTVLEEAHRCGLSVYTSFNFFTEGNITTSDYAVLDRYPGWEEIVQRPEDRGRLLKVTESARGREAARGKLVALAFVNPCRRDVQDFQLLRVEEVLKNYDVDGVVLDRCRYDNLYADFSPESREAFGNYLGARGKTLGRFPDDAFRIDSAGALAPGRYYREWLTFRSQVICDFTGRVRALVDTYREKKKRPLKLAAYVGSWYEAYYQNGVNWASERFVYDKRLQFPESGLYGAEYNRTSYLKYLDFLMIGTYYKTPREVNRYLALGNILTCGEKPVIGSMSLPDLAPADRPGVFAASLENSAGLMIFDYCYTDWPAFAEQMQAACELTNH